MTTYRPADVAELQEIVRAHERVVIRGRGTKPALVPPADGAAVVETTALTGVLEYEPQEYTFTARAGTPVAEVQRMLAEHGQYLPFDPPFANAGATLGGTVAAGLSGPMRYRYGGVRDFILGVRFVDGEGHLVRGGGKVVKNAAGFDLPKLMVGSAGRLGVLVEVTFKVFPRPRAYASCCAPFATLDACLQTLFDVWRRPLDLEAVDLEPTERGMTLWARIGGLEQALPPRLERLRHLLGEANVEVWQGAEEEARWEEAREFRWAPEGWTLVKVPLTPKRIPAVEERLAAVENSRRYSVGGNVLWLATPASPASLDALLRELGLAGVVIRGAAEAPFIGSRKGLNFARRVKSALDPQARFPEV